MPKIARWSEFPNAVQDHLIQRMHDRKIGLDDLNRLRIWLESQPEVPEGSWYKDFGSFKLCGEGRYPKTFLFRARPQPERSSSFHFVVTVAEHDRIIPAANPTAPHQTFPALAPRQFPGHPARCRNR